MIIIFVGLPRNIDQNIGFIKNQIKKNKKWKKEEKRREEEREKEFCLKYGFSKKNRKDG